ncbi:MAG: hypothetical protein HGA22_15145 [Clostridiales bacterium]|nr:hypothetical protein [Clostridiales bacterium]
MEGNIMLALDTFNKCSSFQEYADCAMALIGNPMIIFDMNMHVVACTNVETNDEKYNNMRQKQSPMSAIAENLEWRLEIKDLISNVKVTQTTIKGLDMLHKTMRVNGIIVGQLHSTAYFRPFREDDFRVMELISSRLALEMYQYLSLDQPCGNETDALLQYLLAGHTLNEDVLAVKTALIEWHPTQHLYILCRNKFVGIGQEDEALGWRLKNPRINSFVSKEA